MQLSRIRLTSLALTMLLTWTALADQPPRYTAPSNAVELKQRVEQLRRQYAPFLRSLPQPLEVRERVSLPSKWLFRYEVQDAPQGMKRPDTPGWNAPGLATDDWETATVPQWRYRRGKDGTVLGGKDVFGWGERNEHSNIVWYRTEFAAQQLPEGRRLWLCFAGVDWEAEVYLNGDLLGRHRVYYEPFRFDVTGKVKANNTLAVRVIDGRVFGEPHSFWTPLPDARAEEQVYVRDASRSLKGVLPIGYHGGNGFGILREVCLEQTGPTAVAAIFARNDLSEDAAQVRVEVDAAQTGSHQLRVDLLPENFEGRTYSATAAFELPEGKSVRAVTVPMPEAKSWSPSAPHLYRCRWMRRRESVPGGRRENVPPGVRLCSPAGGCPGKWVLLVRGAPPGGRRGA